MRIADYGHDADPFLKDDYAVLDAVEKLAKAIWADVSIGQIFQTARRTGRVDGLISTLEWKLKDVNLSDPVLGARVSMLIKYIATMKSWALRSTLPRGPAPATPSGGSLGPPPPHLPSSSDGPHQTAPAPSDTTIKVDLTPHPDGPTIDDTVAPKPSIPVVPIVAGAVGVLFLVSKLLRR